MGKEVQSQIIWIRRDVADGCLIGAAREDGDFLGRAGRGEGVADVWDAVWKRDGIIGGGTGGTATALVTAGLINQEGAEIFCWNGVNALGRDEIRWEEMDGEGGGA